MDGLTKKVILSAIALFVLLGFQSAFAVQVYIGDVPGYGYNSGSSPFAGCGPTSGAMILDTYDNRLSGTDGAPGDLVSDPFTTTWDLHNNYMGTGADGFGQPIDFQRGIELYAADQGYLLNAVFHVEQHDDHSAHPGYNPDEISYDVDFWNRTTWDILVDPFLNFIKNEVDAGRPFMATVDSNSDGGDDHWMVGVGYDLDEGQWAGYNTWDDTLHWYDVSSAFIAGNDMGISFIRTFEFGGLIDDGSGNNDNPPVPEPATFLLLGSGLAGLAFYRRKRK